ncbi:hypothetical protein [Hymenobacter volaticus]|uniref:Uncharacterized protein n=1 Tax=Hymenobacter volaticus TaxID=2932254 RepID=A0ABY4GAK8_9BACT|nr:hypothetical protein [Hymenobacter volaticus]UOQ67950.1 hypothetical protein MUN86_08875 [Hymenobacter volaticus]
MTILVAALPFICISSNATSLRTVPLPRFLSTLLFLLATSAAPALAQGGKPPKKPVPPPPIATDKDGKLVYASDSLGNRVPDFSYCGYQAGEQGIPMVVIRVVVPVQAGDATARIQAALDYVSGLPLGKDGFRGAVLLGKGKHEVAGRLLIRASGVVLRGSGMGEEGTTVVGTGYSRDNLITIAGRNDRKLEAAQAITDAYVPVNARTMRVVTPSAFKVGDRVRVQRPSTAAWIEKLGTQSFGAASQRWAGNPASATCSGTGRWWPLRPPASRWMRPSPPPSTKPTAAAPWPALPGRGCSRKWASKIYAWNHRRTPATRKTKTTAGWPWCWTTCKMRGCGR